MAKDSYAFSYALDATIAGTATSPAGAFPVNIPLTTIRATDAVVASFIATATSKYGIYSGTVKTGGVGGTTTTKSEQGAGKTATRIRGFMIRVEAADPALASSGHIQIDGDIVMGATGAISSVKGTKGVYFFLRDGDDASDADDDLEIEFDFTPATNLKATVCLFGKSA